jgi:hypothetical protein
MTDKTQIFRLGDMLVIGKPPGMLPKAAAVIASCLHPVFNEQPWIRCNDVSKESCVLASLTVRDFLRAVGFVSARVRPMTVLLQATQGDQDQTLLHSAAIGHPSDDRVVDSRWPGHLVVTVGDFIIDTTLYQVNRPAWKHLPGMIMTMYDKASTIKMLGLKALTALDWNVPDQDNYKFKLIWLDTPENDRWKDGPDTTDDRRAIVVRRLVDVFHNKDKLPCHDS